MSDKYSNRLVVKNNPKSHISEAYQALRTNIEFLNFDIIDENLKTIMIAGAVPQKEIHINTVNFSLTIAERGKKVIVVDCDLRMPIIHEVFESDSKPGLTNVLVVDKKLSEVIQKADNIHSNLYFIPTGPVPPNPSGLLGSEKMKTVIEDLKKQADTILFLSAPVIGFADSLELANKVDGVILVLNAGIVTKETAKQAKDLLEKAKANILGVVLNNVDIKKEGFFQYYRQYNYSKYYNRKE